MTSAIFQIPDAWIILGCAVFVLLVAGGEHAYHLLHKWNRKYHLISWDNTSIYATDDEDDEY